MATFLEKIGGLKAKEVNARQALVPASELAAKARDTEAPRDFTGALSRPGIAIIAEVKRASPSAGAIAPEIDVAAQTEAYAAGGASAISVLTESSYFGGSLADLGRVRAATKLPLLRKDFIIHPYQVYEARAHGADAILLISDLLGFSDLTSLIQLARELGLAVLVEAHSFTALDQARAVRAEIVGINNRDLKTLKVDANTALKLLPLLGSGVIKVAESGIKTRGDVEAAEKAGADAVLVGEALMRNADPIRLLRELKGDPG